MKIRKLEALDSSDIGGGAEINIIIKNKLCSRGYRDEQKLFFDGKPGEDLYVMENGDFWDLLVRIGIYSSRSQANKDGRYGRELPSGFSDMVIGKKKIRLTVFNPFLKPANPIVEWIEKLLNLDEPLFRLN